MAPFEVPSNPAALSDTNNGLVVATAHFKDLVRPLRGFGCEITIGHTSQLKQSSFAPLLLAVSGSARTAKPRNGSYDMSRLVRGSCSHLILQGSKY